MKLYFTTNLDDPKRDVFELNDKVKEMKGVNLPIPRKGEKITFNFNKNVGSPPVSREFSYDLEVVNVSYSCVKNSLYDSALNLENFHISVKVELHFPTGMCDSIQSWSERFKKHRFGKESY